MTTRADGGPAFPFNYTDPDHIHPGTTAPDAHPGMSLRDYFAAKAMVALHNEASIWVQTIEQVLR